MTGATRSTRAPVHAAPSFSEATVRRLAAQGLLAEVEPGRFVAAPAARGWLKRQASSRHGFRAQHGDLVETREAGDRDRKVLVNLDESPVASLARRPGKNGEAWLSADLATAAERLQAGLRDRPVAAAGHCQLVGKRQRWTPHRRRRRSEGPNRHGACGAPARRPCHAGGRIRTFRGAGRHLLLS